VVQVGDLDPLLLGEIPRADLADFEAVQRLDANLTATPSR
jgi:hypothetical protein